MAQKDLIISIHVPREGHDGNKTSSTDLNKHFNPRAPRGARLGILPDFARDNIISIHVPREGHDINFLLSCDHKEISIHVPREGHDK